MEIFLTVVGQVGIMAIMMAVGFFLSKKRVLTDVGCTEITKILIHIITPCLIINSFASVESGSVSTYNLVMSALLSALVISVGIGVSYLFFRKQSPERRNVLRFGVIFSNAGFVGIPLVDSILGSQGMIYASFFLVIYNIFLWTYGYAMMGGSAKFSIRSFALNPGVIGVVFGLPIYLFGIEIPQLIASPMASLGSVNTPLAMLIAGACIAKLKLKDLVEDMQVYKLAAIRLLLVPAILLGILFLVNPDDILYVNLMIQHCTPPATSVVLLSLLFKKDSKLASTSLAISTLISVITIPFVITAAQILAGLR